MDHLGPLRADLEPWATGTLYTLTNSPIYIYMYIIYTHSCRKGWIHTPGLIYFPLNTENMNPVFMYIYLFTRQWNRNDISVFIVQLLYKPIKRTTVLANTFPGTYFYIQVQPKVNKDSAKGGLRGHSTYQA